MEALAIIILSAAAAGLWYVILVLYFDATEEPQARVQQSPPTNNGPTKNGQSKKGKKKWTASRKKPGKPKAGQSQQLVNAKMFDHHWLVTTLKGHTDQIIGIDLSPNNKYLLTWAKDRIVYLWCTKNFTKWEHRNIRVNIHNDCAKFVRWSPSSKGFVLAREDRKMLEVYKLVRKPDNSVGNILCTNQWPQRSATPRDYVGLGVALKGKYAITCLETGIVELMTKGIPQKRIASPLPETTGSRTSPCGNFIAVFGQQEVVIYQVNLNATLDQVGIIDVAWKVKVKSSSDITSVEFSADSCKIVIACEGGSWHLFDITSSRVNEETKGQMGDVVLDDPNCTIALSADNRVVLVGYQNSLYFFSAFSGELLDKIADVYEESLVSVGFSSDCKFVLSAGDNVVHVFKNIPWYKESIKRFKASLKDASITRAMRDRLLSELSSFERELKEILDPLTQ